MPPGRCAEVAGVIVRISRPREPVIRHFVPFFARDLAGFASDAHSRIRKEADLNIFLYVIVPALVRALCSLADHCLTPFCPPCRDRVKIFRHAVRREVAVQDANSPADQTGARVAQSNQEKQDHAANALGQYCR
jgi:hypothetical protein